MKELKPRLSVQGLGIPRSPKAGYRLTVKRFKVNLRMHPTILLECKEKTGWTVESLTRVKFGSVHSRRALIGRAQLRR